MLSLFYLHLLVPLRPHDPDDCEEGIPDTKALTKRIFGSVVAIAFMRTAIILLSRDDFDRCSRMPAERSVRVSDRMILAL